jgi:hypothetical protein
MKKFLCGTTALVTVGLAAAQVLAASGGIKLGISGYYRASAGLLVGGDQTPTAGGGGLGDFGRTSGGFRQEIRINFKGESALDNGLTVAVLVGIDPATGSTLATELNTAYVDFKGKYGDVRFGTGTGTGSQLDALSLTCVYDPGNVTSNFGVNSANQDFTNAGLARTVGGKGKTVGVATFETAAATCSTMTGHATSIDYFSPTFGGFNFDISYTPEANTASSSGSQGIGAGTDLKNQTAENILSVGADFNHDFGAGWTLLVGGGGQWAFTAHTASGGPLPLGHKPSQYNVGLQVGIPGGWTVGAAGAYYVSYPNQGFFSLASTDAGTSGADGWVGAVGVSYTIDAVSLGLEGIYGRYQVHQGTPSAGHDAVSGISLNGTYALGPGINLEGQVAYTRYDPAVGTPSSTNPLSYDAVEIDSGIAINF